MFAPRKCGVKYEPPTLVLYYDVNSTGKLHKRSMPLRDLKEGSDISQVVRDLKDSSRHGKFLQEVSSDQLEKLVKMIQDKMKGLDPRLSPKQRLDLNEDMSKLDDLELNKRKALMSETFEKHQVKREDQDFVYNKEVTFSEGRLESGWDDDEDYSDPDF